MNTWRNTLKMSQIWANGTQSFLEKAIPWTASTSERSKIRCNFKKGRTTLWRIFFICKVIKTVGENSVWRGNPVGSKFIKVFLVKRWNVHNSFIQIQCFVCGFFAYFTWAMELKMGTFWRSSLQFMQILDYKPRILGLTRSKVPRS